MFGPGGLGVSLAGWLKFGERLSAETIFQREWQTERYCCRRGTHFRQQQRLRVRVQSDEGRGLTICARTSASGREERRLRKNPPVFTAAGAHKPEFNGGHHLYMGTGSPGLVSSGPRASRYTRRPRPSPRSAKVQKGNAGHKIFRSLFPPFFAGATSSSTKPLRKNGYDQMGGT